MSANLNKTAEALFEKIRSRFEDVSVGDQTAVATQDPEQARFFNFEYTDRSGNKFGNVTVSLIDEDSLKVYFSKSLSSDLDELQKTEWYDFLRDLRMFAKRNLLNFDTRDISRSNLRLKDIKQVATSTDIIDPTDVSVQENRMFGSTKTSYLPLDQNTRLTIKHNGHIDDSQKGARSRKIHAVYIEDAEGQRLKCPTNNLTACKVLGRHVASGGQLHDEFGLHLYELVNEMGKIKRFVSGSRHKTFEDGEANQIAHDAKERYQQIHHMLHSMKGPKGYRAYKESWSPGKVDEAADFDFDELKSKFVQKSFDPRLEDGLTYAYRAHKNKQISEFEDWANKITEGSWELPDNDQKVKQLQDLMSDTLTAGIDGINATSALYDILGDDVLFDRIYDASKGSPDMDIRPIVYSWLEDNMPSVFEKVKSNMAAGGIKQNKPTADVDDTREEPKTKSADDSLDSVRRLAGLKQ